MNEYKYLFDSENKNNKLIDDNFESVVFSNTNDLKSINNYNKNLYKEYNDILEDEETLFGSLDNSNETSHTQNTQNTQNTVSTNMNIERFSNYQDNQRCPLVYGDKMILYNSNKTQVIKTNNNKLEFIVKPQYPSGTFFISKYTDTNTYKPIGAYRDTSNRALRNGPKAYGYNPKSCYDATGGAYGDKYFALQDGGWCSSDNDKNHALKYGKYSYQIPVRKYRYVKVRKIKKRCYNKRIKIFGKTIGRRFCYPYPVYKTSKQYYTINKKIYNCQKGTQGGPWCNFIFEKQNKRIGDKQGDLVRYGDKVFVNKTYTNSGVYLTIKPGPNNNSKMGSPIFYKDNIILENAENNIQCIPRRALGQQCSIRYPHFNEDGNYEIQEIKVKCDDVFEMYVNGKTYKGSGLSKFTDVSVSSPEGFIIGFKCYNGGGTGGLIAQIKLTNGSLIVTDNSWRAKGSLVVPEYFQKYTDSYTLADWVLPNVFQDNQTKKYYNPDSNFSKYANWIWYGNNTIANQTVYLAKKIGAPPSGEACSHNLTNSQALCYMDRYIDLRNATASLSTKNQKIVWLKYHWKNYGCREGRTYDCVKPPATVGNYDYQGCYFNEYNNDVMNNKWGKKNTLQECKQVAEKNKQMVFGMIDDGNCYTSNDLTKAKKNGIAEACMQRGSYGKFQIYNRNKPFEPIINKLSNSNYSGKETFINQNEDEQSQDEQNIMSKIFSKKNISIIILLLIIMLVVYYWNK